MHTPVSTPRLLQHLSAFGVKGRSLVTLIGTIFYRRIMHRKRLGEDLHTADSH
jgi:hypothetical protein